MSRKMSKQCFDYIELEDKAIESYLKESPENIVIGTPIKNGEKKLPVRQCVAP